MSSLIIRPEVSEAAEKAKRNARQQERRRIALSLLPTILAEHLSAATDVALALEFADELLKATELED